MMVIFGNSYHLFTYYASIRCRGIQTDLDLDDLADEDIAGAIPDLLTDYSAECRDWTLVAGEHWKQGRWTRVEELLIKGLECALSSDTSLLVTDADESLHGRHRETSGPDSTGQPPRHARTFTPCVRSLSAESHVSPC